jgi:hypothetical protein
VVAVVGVALGFCGAVGESVAQDNTNKDGKAMMKDDKMMQGDKAKKQ